MIVRTFEGLQALTTPGPRWSNSSSSSLSLYGLNQAYGEIYRTQPNVRICVDFLARNVAQLGLPVYRRISDTDRERLNDHDLAKWLSNPNPATCRYRLIESLVADIAVYFNAYWLKVRYQGADSRDAIGLVRLPPEEMAVNGGLLPTDFTWTAANGQTRDFPLSEVVYFNGYNPTNACAGLSPLETLRRILAEEAAAGDHRESFWRNAARHEGVVTRPKEAKRYTTDQLASWREQWQKAYGGEGGKTVLLQDGETFTPTSFSAKDSEFIQGGKLRREVCAAQWHIPQPMVGILEHATFCLPGDAEVFTEEGPKAIADVREHDRVWSLADGGAWVLQPVQRSACTGADQILTVRTSNRTLRLNDRHRVLVRRAVDETPAPVETMADGHRRSIGRATKVWASVYVPASDLKVGDTIVTVNHLPTSGLDVAPSGRALTTGFMEVCGLLVGDGNISRKNGQPIGLQLARSEHATYMEPYRQALRAEFRQRGLRPITLTEGGRQTRFMSVTAARELDLLGFGGTARTKRVPGWVFQSTEPLRLAFLRGFLDADGSVDKKGRISFSSCNPTMLSQVRHLCLSVGVPVTNLRCQRGQTQLPNGRIVAFAQWTFACSDPGENQRIGSHTPAYVMRMAEGQPFGRKARRYPWHGGRGFESGALQLSGVLSIERSVVAVPVYDLDVAGTHNFIAEGVVVHNSNIREQHKHLYQDCLGPLDEMITQEIERQLLVECEDRDSVYIEFNIDAKLAGSFEEQALALRTAVGKPFMKVNEARAIRNLPRDDDPESDRIAPQQGGPADATANPNPQAPNPATAGAEAIAPILEAARQRQYARLNKLPAAERSSAFFADLDRWNRELTEDLLPIAGDDAARVALEANIRTFTAFEAEDV